MATGKQKKVSRRGFLRGVIKRIKFEHLEDDQASGLSPELIEADQALKQCDYVRAAKLYSQYLEKEPDHLEALQKAGYCYFRLNEMSTARNFWHKVLEIRPKDNFAVLHMGLSFAREGNLKDAVKMWKSYFNINQPLIQREINVTLALYEAGENLDPQEVASSLEKAIEKQKKASVS
ncbi:tetratricopeptide repeat protein [Desulfohalobiaceae bacterium Ax17]|uniref:tetratricopeptide repeat protein n=1 Tax=Desulfovulcanus ferrireducens TaxID=2831190 RepID=UPI00207BA71F|nr:tetratricopeptide repeat protein [Desulfovulcanus ferrireducens]MBT8763811.1 tetratricopeptide repeat protein [Desulfovulcanus ferrireducens]